MGESNGIEFLKGLDARVRSVERVRDKVWRRSYIEEYTKRTISENEIEKVLQVVQDENLLFFPINTNRGFSVGFQVMDGKEFAPGVQELELLLRFKEEQLPESYDFRRLSEMFLRERNQQLIEYFKLEPIRERSYYTY